MGVMLLEEEEKSNPAATGSNRKLKVVIMVVGLEEKVEEGRDK